MDCLKNPFVFSVLTAVIIYGVFYWKYKKEEEQDPSQPRKKVPYLYPLGGALLAGLFAHFQFPQKSYKVVQVTNPMPSANRLLPLPEIFLDFGTF